MVETKIIWIESTSVLSEKENKIKINFQGTQLIHKENGVFFSINFLTEGEINNTLLRKKNHAEIHMSHFPLSAISYVGVCVLNLKNQI